MTSPAAPGVMRAGLVALAATALAAGATAQVPGFDPAPILACLDDPVRDESCVGAGALACMAQGSGGTDRLTECHQAELAWWEGLLQQEGAAMLQAQAGVDADLATLPRFAERPAGAPLLQAVLESFADWRESLCAYEALQFWSTDGEAFTHAECRMRLTGDMVLTLRRIAAGGG